VDSFLGGAAGFGSSIPSYGDIGAGYSGDFFGGGSAGGGGGIGSTLLQGLGRGILGGLTGGSSPSKFWGTSTRSLRKPSAERYAEPVSSSDAFFRDTSVRNLSNPFSPEPMSTSLPTNYDWSSTQAPSGPFGTASIPGAESVLGNLGGLGALGSKGLGSFFESIGSGALNLNNLSRLAGTVGNFIGPGFDVEASTEALDERAKKD
jgi:hypothetical protein